MKIVAILGANVLMLILGVGLLPMLHLARTRRDLVTRLPLAYATGLAATGILAADLAVVHIAVGWVGLALLACGSVALGLRRLTDGPPLSRFRLRSAVPGVVLTGFATALFVHAARLFAVKPLVEYDGWVIWATRARALYIFGHPSGPVFTSAAYPQLQHPLLLPALEALDFRAMGVFDGTAVHLQLLGFALAFVGGGWFLLRRHTSPVLLAATLLAAITAPSFLIQLETNFADVPLACFVALGVAALATSQFPAAALFLGAAVLTKNEGEAFALAALLAAALVSRPTERRPLALTAAAVLAVDVPWRAWIALHHLKSTDYSLSHLFSPRYLNDHRERVEPSAIELWHQIWSGAWSYVAVLVLAVLVASLVLRRFRDATFCAAWLALSFAGLLAIYWISNNPLSNHLFNSADRTIDSLLLGGALLVPVLLKREPEPVESV